MASNDQWPPVASPSSGKGQSRGKNSGNKRNTKDHQRMVLDRVTEMFHSTLDTEVILSIAQNYDWELQSTIDALIALSATVEDQKSPDHEGFTVLSKPMNHEKCVKTSDEVEEELLKMDEAELRQQLEGFTKFEYAKKNSTKNRMDSFRGNISKLDSTFNEAPTNMEKNPIPSSPWNLASNPNKKDKGKAWQNNNSTYPSANLFMQNNQSSPEPQAANFCQTHTPQTSEKSGYSYQGLPPNPFDQNQTKTKNVDANLNKSKNDSELCGLKVHYRLLGMESSSDDDDADVVVEEELNNYNISTPISVNVSQFLSSSIQTAPRCIQTSQRMQTMTTASPPRTPRRTVYEATLNRIKFAINRGDNILVILRGLPGSGKSSLAKSLITTTVGGDPALHIFSTDDYFCVRGVYRFDPSRLEGAHDWNQRRVLNALKEGKSPIIIDNTNLQAWEMHPYAAMAVKQGYIVEVLEINTPWAQNINELAKRNAHGVPKDKISTMLSKYERGISGQKLMELFSLKYPADNTPRMQTVVPTINKKDVLTAEDMVVLQKIDQLPNTFADDIKRSDDNLKSATSGMDTLLDYLRDLEITEDVKDRKEKVVAAIDESEEEKETLKANLEDSYLLQPLGAIGSERKNSLVPLEVVSPPREPDDYSGRESKENVLSQCWDFTLMLNGRTLHSDHRDDAYYCGNSGESPINADDMRKQDEEFGKEGNRDTESPSLDTSEDNLSEEDCNLEPKNMDEFLEALTKGYNDAVSSFDQKKSTVIITEIIEGDTSVEILHSRGTEDLQLNEPLEISTIDMTRLISDDDTQDMEDCNDKKEETRSEDSMAIDALKNIEDDIKEVLDEILLPDAEAEPENTSVEDKDLSFIDAEDTTPELILREDSQEPAAKSAFGSLFEMLKTSILGVSTDEELTTEAKEKEAEEIMEMSNLLNEKIDGMEKICEAREVYSHDIVDALITETKTAIIDTECATRNNCDNDEPESIVEFFSLEDTNNFQDNNTFKDSLESEKKEENNSTSTEIHSSESEDDKEAEKVDNINRITWKESPFPVDDVSILKLNSEVETFKESVTMTDSSTCTTYYDFNVAYVGGIPNAGYRVVNATSRHINEGLVKPEPEHPPRKLMLHKSSMTGDVFNRDGNPDFEDENERKDRIPELMELFPHIPRDYLTEIYEKLCQKDFDWAVEVLLDGVPNDLSMKFPEEMNKDDGEVISCLPETLNDLSSSSDSSKEAEIIVKGYGEDELQEKNTQKDDQEDRIHVEEEEKYLDDHELLEEVKTDISDDTSSQSTISRQHAESRDYEKSLEPEETMELNLGFDFIRSLENQFGNPDFHVPDGFLPVVQIKKSMAEELYALWIESMYQQLNARHEQLDQMIAKDAEFAKSLEREMELEEARGSNEPAVPNLDEIMDMELALASYKNETKSIIARETPDDMASRLSRQMLHESLPDIDPQTLNEILKAHNGNFKETFDIIELSTGRSITPCNTLKKQKNLMERVKEEHAGNSGEKQKSRSNTPIIVVRSDSRNERTQSKNALTNAKSLRKEAQRQFSLRIENFNKAAEAYKRGYPEVAAYYSEVARLHLKNIETAHMNAASALVEAQTLGENEDTLDLHYLYVTEALHALDEFLENHWAKLAKSNRRSSTVYIVTGRGARSNNGTSKIKPAVSKKLNSLNIRFSEENPGCLKVTLRKNRTTD